MMLELRPVSSFGLARPRPQRLLPAAARRRPAVLLKAAALSSSDGNGNSNTSTNRCLAAAPAAPPTRMLDSLAAFQAAVADGRHDRVVEFDGLERGGGGMTIFVLWEGEGGRGVDGCSSRTSQKKTGATPPLGAVVGHGWLCAACRFQQRRAAAWRWAVIARRR